MKTRTFIPFIILLIASANLLLAQPQPPDTLWTQAFGGDSLDIGFSVLQTSDGGFIITGETESYGIGSGDVYLIKTDNQGNEQWYNTFGGVGEEWGRTIKQTFDSGYIIVGVTESFGAGSWDIYLIKTDSQGNEQWHRTFGGSNCDEGYDVLQTSDLGYILVGETGSYGAGSYDVYLIKTDSQGYQQWYQTFGGIDEDEGYSIQQTTDGGFIIAGWTLSYGAGDRDFYLIKTDEQGNQQWDNTFGGINLDEGHCVRQTFDGGFIIVGTTSSYGAGNMDVYLIKTDSLGNQQWYNTFGGYENDGGFKIEQLSDGGFIILGLTWSYGAGDCDVYLIRTDSQGNELWYETFWGSDFNGGYSIQQTFDSGFIIAGGIGPYIAGDCDVYLIRLAPEGSLVEGFGSNRPAAFTLRPACPNPFNPETVIAFELPSEAMVNLFAYDINGRKVSTIANSLFSRGWRRVNFDGSGLASGIYFIRLQAGEYQAARKCLLMK